MINTMFNRKTVGHLLVVLVVLVEAVAGQMVVIHSAITTMIAVGVKNALNIKIGMEVKPCQFADLGNYVARRLNN